jgi:hypothetical protein
LFGDALGDVPPSPEAKPLDGNASSSRFAKWFNQDAANKVDIHAVSPINSVRIDYVF